MFKIHAHIWFFCALVVLAGPSNSAIAQDEGDQVQFDRAIEFFADGKYEEAQETVFALDLRKSPKALHYFVIIEQWKEFRASDDENTDGPNHQFLSAFSRSEYPESKLFVAETLISIQNGWVLTKRVKEDLVVLQDLGLLDAFRLHLLASSKGWLDQTTRAKLDRAWSKQKSKLGPTDRLFWKTLVAFMAVETTVSLEEFYDRFSGSLELGDARVYELACRMSLRGRLMTSRPLEKLRACIFGNFFGGSVGIGRMAYFASPKEIDDAWDWSKPDAFDAVKQITDDAIAAVVAMAEQPGSLVFEASNWCREQDIDANAHAFCLETSAIVHSFCIYKAHGLDLASDFAQSPAYANCRRVSFEKQQQMRGNR